MGDGISILTNLGKVGAVARVSQAEQAAARTQEEAAKQLTKPKEPESVLLKDVTGSERSEPARERRRRNRRSRERARRRSGSRSRKRGNQVDFKA